jgi:hypothetical protein
MSRKKSNNSADVRLWSRTIMGNLSRKRNLAAYVNERNFPFVVQIAVPDDGFGSRLDAINAWHLYSKNKQRRGRPQSLGEKKFWRWCFKDFETAEKLDSDLAAKSYPDPSGALIDEVSTARGSSKKFLATPTSPRPKLLPVAETAPRRARARLRTGSNSPRIGR